MSYSTSNPVRYFGQQVRRARRAAGWTLTEFGQRIGYDPGQISRIAATDAAGALYLDTRVA